MSTKEAAIASPLTEERKGANLIRTETVTLDAAFGAQFEAAHERFEGERPFRQAHCNGIRRAMDGAKWLPERSKLAYCHFKGKTIRLDGQHTIRAIRETEKPHSYTVAVDIYEAETMEQVRTTYQGIDLARRKSKSEQVDAGLKGTPEYEGVAPEMLHALASGIGICLWTDGERSEHDGQEIADLLLDEHLETARAIVELLTKTKSPEHMLRGPVVAAMFTTYVVDTTVAAKFWRGVAKGTNLDDGDPALTLRDLLMKTKVGAGGAMSAKSRRQAGLGEQVSQEYMFRICIAGWNAKVRGKTPVNLHPAEGRREEALIPE